VIVNLKILQVLVEAKSKAIPFVLRSWARAKMKANDPNLGTGLEKKGIPTIAVHNAQSSPQMPVLYRLDFRTSVHRLRPQRETNVEQWNASQGGAGGRVKIGFVVEERDRPFCSFCGLLPQKRASADRSI
jgi:hypothetical protein